MKIGQQGRWGKFLVAALLLAMAPTCLFGRDLGASPASGGGAIRRSVAVTIDDLPCVKRPLPGRTIAGNVRRLVSQLQAANAPAWGFVCGRRAGLASLRIWLDGGFRLGNHSYTHPAFSKVSIVDYLADLSRNEAVVRRVLGIDLRGGYFRHPFLDHGHSEAKVAALSRYLVARDYEVAPVSLDTVDYRFDVYYRRKVDRGAVLRHYVQHVRECASHFEALSLRLYRREVPLILLLHANDINADHLGAVLSALRGRGYAFIRLQEALDDPIYDRYRLRPPLIPRRGDRNFFNQVALARGMKVEDPSGDAYFRRYWRPRLEALADRRTTRRAGSERTAR